MHVRVQIHVHMQVHNVQEHVIMHGGGETKSTCMYPLWYWPLHVYFIGGLQDHMLYCCKWNIVLV